jgi:YkoY family integral membrane protein
VRELLQQIFDNPLASLAIIGNLIIIESLLSVDNAAVLATMVMDLPNNIRPKALRYGIWGAYIFRGLALIFASFLTKIWWLKPIGGLYLLYLVWDWRKGKMTETEEDNFINKQGNFFYRVAIKSLGNFWATVLVVEIMDMAFSIDNVFAAVAFSSNIILIITGVFIGIFAMRFIAQWFVKLMEKYQFLETSAFIVIGLLGIKLLLSLYEHFMPQSFLGNFLQSRSSDIAMSILTILVFFVPILVAIIKTQRKSE